MADEVLENLKMWTADPLCVAAAKRIESDGAEIERLRAALREARQAINDYGLDDFEDTTHEALAKIDIALGVEQSEGK